MIAYCWANGLIGFGRACPEGAIEIARGPARPLRSLIERTSRVSRHDNQTLFVPGVPEAPNQDAGLEALRLHLRWLKRSPPENIEIATKESPLPLRVLFERRGRQTPEVPNAPR